MAENDRVYSSAESCPVHHERLRRRPGASVWRCPRAGCKTTRPRLVSSEWLARLDALGLLKDEEA